jgi:hypothetical protein
LLVVVVVGFMLLAGGGAGGYRNSYNGAETVQEVMVVSESFIHF